MTDLHFTFLRAPAARAPDTVLHGLRLPGILSEVTQAGPAAPGAHARTERAARDLEPTLIGGSHNRPFDAIANTRIQGLPGAPERPSFPRVPLPAGTMLHKYRIERVIGEGGFALTYQAIEPVLGRTVAIKELFMSQINVRRDGHTLELAHGSEDAQTYEWVKFFFSREAQITFGLRHEGIVRMYEFFRTNNTAYIVYEFLQGETLDQWCKARAHKVNQAEMLRFLDRVGRALRYVHQSRVLHRDIKPENIFVERLDTVPVIIDFGAARELGGDDPAGIPIITSGFSPPEQYVAGGRQDERSDIYSFAATLYWMLSGARLQDALERKTHDELAHVREKIEPSFGQSQRLADAIMRGLSVEAADRQPNVDAFLDDVFPKVTLVNTGYEARPKGDKIFVSYRRDDSAHFAGRLLDFLEMRFGSGSVFFDVESIPVGIDFWDHIKAVLSECAVMLVVMGPRWTPEIASRRKRWYQMRGKADYVAQEIAAAAELKLPIIPVLFDGAQMPSPAGLPPTLGFLPKLNAALISDGKAFRSGADGICDQVAKLRKSFYEERP